MNNRKYHISGFTLIEMLLVIVIIAIMTSIAFFSLLRSFQQTALREAAVQVAADLKKSRLNAQKTGQLATLTITPNTSSYSMQTGTATPIIRQLPKRIVITNAVGVANISYQPPYGTLAAGGVTWQLVNPSNPDLRLFIKITGITGKVSISERAN